MKMNAAIVVTASGLLAMLGILAQFSYSVRQESLTAFYVHLLLLGFGGLCCAATAAGNYQWLRSARVSWALLGLALVLLLAVFVPGIGISRNNAARWLALGQPSEFAKLALIVFLAGYGARQEERSSAFVSGFVVPAAAAGAIVVLVFREPDWGSAALLAALTLAMLSAAGVRWRYLLPTVAAGSLIFAYQLSHNTTHQNRVLSFMHPEKFRNGPGWQNWHAIIALGAGGPVGEGSGMGSMKNGFIPEQQSDFVLSIIGQELGLAGTLLVLMLYAAIAIAGARIALQSSCRFGRLLAFGVTFLIGLQAFINIGVVTSVLPNKGIALPLVSHGGSNIIVVCIALGLLISVARRSPVLEPAENSKLIETPRTRFAGPAGSLLVNSTQPPARGLWRRLARWQRARRFRAEPLHGYQKWPIGNVQRPSNVEN